MFPLPKSLESIRTSLEKTTKRYISIEAKKGNSPRTASKFGGTPYWPHDMVYPMTPEGKPLTLLAQIRFDEIIEPLEGYPTTGMLQFFIYNDDLYGMDFDELTNQNTFRVVFHEHVDEDPASWLGNIPQSDDEYFLVNEECSLTFKLCEEIMPMSDYRFNLAFSLEEICSEEELDDVAEEFWREHSGMGHKLGGYPYFTQWDPREGSIYEDYELLLQLDTDNNVGIMWGDVGVGNFFIRPEDLRKRDFSKVLYTWDCH